MYTFEKAFNIAEHVAKNIVGRAADGGMSLPYLISMAISAGAGDHLEIGTLFGASAISVALAKKEWGFPGKVYCIDPYKPRDPNLVAYKGSPELFEGSPEALNENARKFGVADRIELVKTESQPWPEPLANKRFVSSYIDGDHIGLVPWYDFIECARRTDHYVAFDNFEEGYPEVENAVLRAVNGSEWCILYKNVTFVALRRRRTKYDRSVTDMNRV